MPELSIAIPNIVGVISVFLYFGLSAGWHIGKNMTYYDTKRKEGMAQSKLLKKFLWRASHHYDMGVGIMAISLYYILPQPPITNIIAFTALGLGAGIAYSDKKDAPPDGIMKTMFSEIRTQATK